MAQATRIESDSAPWLRPAERSRPNTERESFYLPMRDGIRIAVDLHRPRGHRRPMPTILRQTRYYRGVSLREPFRRLPIEWLIDHTALTRDYFLTHGYAWVDVCVRGSGASYGHRPFPWSSDEVADGAEIVDWIVAQSWSNGRVGSTGVSYDGTCAEFLATNLHPAVRAIAPRFCLFDVYPDVAFPGGIHLAWFTACWNTFNRALDDGGLDIAFALKLRNQLQALRELPSGRLRKGVLTLADRDAFDQVAKPFMRMISSGVRRVDGDEGDKLAAAVSAHRGNFNVHEGALAIRYRDDTGVSDEFPDATVDEFSPHRLVTALQSSGAAIYNYSGWDDGAYQHAAVKRFLTVEGSAHRLILGPWEHGGMQNTSPHSSQLRAAFAHDEELRGFFDAHLRDDGHSTGPRVRYFTVGQGKWKDAPTWPPPEARPRRYCFAANRELCTNKEGRSGVDEYVVDLAVGSGRRSRWNSLLGLLPPVGYTAPERAEQRLLLYRSLPLRNPLEVTGHPIVTIFVASNRPEAHLFVYLFDETPDGRRMCVTEGQLDLHHRKVADTRLYATPGVHRTFERADASAVPVGTVERVALDLLPTSWQFDEGHRIAVGIAGADCDHFATLASAPTFAVHYGADMPSHIDLPVMPRCGPD